MSASTFEAGSSETIAGSVGCAEEVRSIHYLETFCESEGCKEGMLVGLGLKYMSTAMAREAAEAHNLPLFARNRQTVAEAAGIRACT